MQTSEHFATHSSELTLQALPVVSPWEVHEIRLEGANSPWIVTKVFRTDSVNPITRALKALFTLKSVPRTKTILVHSETLFYPPELVN